MEDNKFISAEIKLTKHAPIEISGNFEIIGINGKVLNTDFSNEVYLCACGRSNSKPFCDGSHKK